MACQQGTLTPPDTWSCPTLGLACVLMSKPISPELGLVSGPLNFEHPSVLIFCLTQQFKNAFIQVRLGYYFTPYQRLWLYNGAPLLAFYDTLGIRRTYSRLKPPASSRGHLYRYIHETLIFYDACEPPWGRRGFKSRIRTPYPQRVVKGD